MKEWKNDRMNEGRMKEGRMKEWKNWIDDWFEVNEWMNGRADWIEEKTSGAQSFIYDISEISGGLFLEFFLWHDMTKRVMLFHSVRISFFSSSPLKEKMIFSDRFIHPMKKFVFMPFTAVFQEKFHSWYQMKGNDMVYHLRRAQAWVATQSHKNATNIALLRL